MKLHALAVLAGTAFLASCGSESGSADQAPEIDRAVIQQFMAEQVQPTAEIYWGSAGWVSDEDGMHDLTPTTEEGWAATLQSTRDLQEFAKELQGDTYAEGRGQEWLDFSASLLEISQKAEQTALDRDSDAIFETGGVMYRVCKACHDAYAPEEPPIEDPTTD